jgi:hypothetical protein
MVNQIDDVVIFVCRLQKIVMVMGDRFRSHGTVSHSCRRQLDLFKRYDP